MRLKRSTLVVVWAVATCLWLSAPAAAHETKAVGDDAYLLIVGFAKEPPYTGERTGLDLIVRRSSDQTPVEHLANTLFAEIVAPDGTARRTLTLRAQWGAPGQYTDDFVLTEPGVYTIRIWGRIHDVEFDETFQSHEVKAIESLQFP